MSSPATTPLTYNGFVTAICNLAVINSSTVGGIVTGNDKGKALVCAWAKAHPTRASYCF